MNWSFEIRLHETTVASMLGTLAIFEIVWCCVNVLGIRKCKRFAADGQKKGLAINSLMVLAFLAMILFQFLFLLRQFERLGGEMAG